MDEKSGATKGIGLGCLLAAEMACNWVAKSVVQKERLKVDLKVCLKAAYSVHMWAVKLDGRQELLTVV